MCRNIKLLHDLLPPATAEEIKLSALQYVRKLSGMRAPSQANQQIFDRAVSEVVTASTRLLRSLAPGRPHSREELRLKAVERGRRREEQNRARVLATLGASDRHRRSHRAAHDHAHAHDHPHAHEHESASPPKGRRSKTGRSAARKSGSNAARRV